jgi:hypothetical protein
VLASTPEHLANRICALLDKAESTTYAAEAEVFMAKAQELMSRHAIDEAMLTARHQPKDDLVDERVVVNAPYASAKSSLLAAVASPNRCRVMVASSSRGNQYCVVVGHRTDADNVLTIFRSLQWQAENFMRAEVVPPGETPRRFRHAFLVAYAHRIGHRLRLAGEAVQAEASGAFGSGEGDRSVEVVLADRQREVDRYFSELFPSTRRTRVSASSGAGYQQGRAAADRAALGGRALPGALRALPGGRTGKPASRSQAQLGLAP